MRDGFDDDPIEPVDAPLQEVQQPERRGRKRARSEWEGLRKEKEDGTGRKRGRFEEVEEPRETEEEGDEERDGRVDGEEDENEQGRRAAVMAAARAYLDELKQKESRRRAHPPPPSPTICPPPPPPSPASSSCDDQEAGPSDRVAAATLKERRRKEREDKEERRKKQEGREEAGRNELPTVEEEEEERTEVTRDDGGYGFGGDFAYDNFEEERWDCQECPVKEAEIDRLRFERDEARREAERLREERDAALVHAAAETAEKERIEAEKDAELAALRVQLQQLQTAAIPLPPPLQQPLVVVAPPPPPPPPAVLPLPTLAQLQQQREDVLTELGHLHPAPLLPSIQIGRLHGDAPTMIRSLTTFYRCREKDVAAVREIVEQKATDANLGMQQHSREIEDALALANQFTLDVRDVQQQAHALYRDLSAAQGHPQAPNSRPMTSSLEEVPSRQRLLLPSRRREGSREH